MACMSRASERSAQTRRDIIRAVLRIIGERGVAGLTNRRIAAEAQVSLGSITYHFATQQDLLRESLLSFVSAETQRFTELADKQDLNGISLDQAAALVAQVEASTIFDSEHIAPFELFIQAGRDPELRAAVTDAFAAYDRVAASILAALNVPASEATAKAVVALIMGQTLRRLATGSAIVDLTEPLLTLLTATPDQRADLHAHSLGNRPESVPPATA